MTPRRVSDAAAGKSKLNNNKKNAAARDDADADNGARDVPIAKRPRVFTGAQIGMIEA